MLVIDDQPYNIFVLKELLSGIEFIENIESALNGEIGLEMTIQNSNNPTKKCAFHYILIDLHMPVLDGFQVRSFIFYLFLKLLQRLRKMEAENLINLRETKLIAVSAIS